MRRFAHFNRLVLLGTATLLPMTQVDAIIVFDPSNYAQNVLQAGRALQQINQQIQSLQNQATMIMSMAKNLDHLNVSSLSQMTASLQQISSLMSKAQGISYELTESQKTFQALFPGQQGSLAQNSGNALQAAQARAQSVLASLSHSVTMQSNIVTTLSADTATLATLVTSSQSAHGNLQAQQANNQLMALLAKQQMQLETLIASQGRADGVARAAQAQSEIEGRAQTERFLGTGHAYP